MHTRTFRIRLDTAHSESCCNGFVWMLYLMPWSAHYTSHALRLYGTNAEFK